MSALVLVYSSPSGGFELTLPISTDGSLTSVDWGDETPPDQSYTHTYTNADPTSYTVTITGAGITELSQLISSSPTYLTECTSFGDIGLTSLNYAFFDCSNLITVPTSLPASVQYMNGMFQGASVFNQNISSWNVSSVTYMNGTFESAQAFNNGGVALTWGTNTSNVTNMSNMFKNATSFNQDISGWNVSAVTDMSNMFENAYIFNNGGVALTWGINTGSVQNMSYMFYEAYYFNQNISGWDVSSVTDMAGMFNSANFFNQNISGWDVSSVTNMSYMFIDASSFNNGGVALTWGINTGSVTNMNAMFNGASAFNQNISGWDVSSVTDMNYMFYSAIAFNQDISTWDVSSVAYMSNMFQNASSFNQDLSSWNVSSVTTFDNTFTNSLLSTTNYNNILIGWSLLTLEQNVNFTNLGLVYSPNGLTAHTTIIDDYLWNFVGDAYLPTDILKTGDIFSLTINGIGTFAYSGHNFQLYYLETPFSSEVYYDGSSMTITFTNLVFSTSGNLTLVLKDNTSDSNVTSYRFTVYSSTLVCFKEDSKILTNHGYIPIQHLRKGDLIQTLKDGFKPIYMIGKKEIHHQALKERIKDQLYVCSKEQYPDIIDEDLVITGCHSILVKSFKDDEQKEKATNLQNGKIYVTDDHYRLPACLDDKTSVYEPEGIYTIYHLALDHDNYYMNYGIYANGLLVESCTKNYLERLSGMTIIE